MTGSKGGEARGEKRRRVAGVAALVTLAACIGSGSSTGPSGGSSNATPTSSSATVGLAGGHVMTSDGAIDVFLPYGALSSNVTIKVQKIDAPAAGSVGTAFEISPSGTTFTKPIVLTFHYRTADLGGADPETLSIATFEGGQWRLYPSRTDMGAGTVAADVPHFSPWALVLPGSGTIVDAGVPPADAGPVDATVPQDAARDIGSVGNDAAAGAGGTGGKGGAGGTTGAAGTGGKGGAGGTTGAAGAGGKGGTTGSGGLDGGAAGSGGASGHDGGAGTTGSGGTTGAAGTSGNAGNGGSTGASGTAGTDGGTSDGDASAEK